MTVAGPAPAGAEVEVLRHLPVGVYRTTPDGGFLYANAELAAMLGYGSVAELSAVNTRDLYADPADRVRWQSAITADGRVTDFDVEKRRKDGTSIWLRDNARAVRDESGAVVSYEGAVIDVTRQHQAERELRASEARFRALVEAIPDAIFLFGPDRLCQEARLGGLARSFPPAVRCVGASFEAIFDDDLAKLCRAAADTARDGGPVAIEHVTKGPHVEAFFDVCVTATEGGGALVLVRDATSARRFREWMLRSERLASVGSLATGVAHEINNPLTAVLGSTDFARELVVQCRVDAEDRVARHEPAFDQRAKDALVRAEEALDEVLQAASRIADTVRSLKSVAEPAGEEQSSVVLEAVLETAIRVVKNHIRHRAELVRQIERLPPVWGNATRLEDVFVGLLVNAAEAIEPGRADQNEVRVSAREGADGRVVVEVRDTGAGIAIADVERIFDPFFTTKSPGRGTGMGLAVCRSILSSVGGEIQVASAPGQGTTFTVHLLSAKTAPAPRPTLPATSRRRSRGRVAVIDDEALVGSALERMLKNEHEVTVTQSAQSVIDALDRGERFDVILCDVMMPVLTGVAFHRIVAARYPDQAPAIMFISGGVFTDDMRRYLAQIPNVTLEKPVLPGTLLRAVAEQVERARV
ncbi:MAG: PAS domain S-box protein [Polyangiaceae bacterium]|nr:PAS domain S-box protein [Polyangiaceae bacterium]